MNTLELLKIPSVLLVVAFAALCIATQGTWLFGPCLATTAVAVGHLAYLLDRDFLAPKKAGC